MIRHIGLQPYPLGSYAPHIVEHGLVTPHYGPSQYTSFAQGIITVESGAYQSSRELLLYGVRRII